MFMFVHRDSVRGDSHDGTARSRESHAGCYHGGHVSVIFCLISFRSLYQEHPLTDGARGVGVEM